MPLSSLDLENGMRKWGSVGIVLYHVFCPSTNPLTRHKSTKMSNFLEAGLCRRSKLRHRSITWHDPKLTSVPNNIRWILHTSTFILTNFYHDVCVRSKKCSRFGQSQKSQLHVRSFSLIRTSQCQIQNQRPKDVKTVGIGSTVCWKKVITSDPLTGH